MEACIAGDIMRIAHNSSVSMKFASARAACRIDAALDVIRLMSHCAMMQSARNAWGIRMAHARRREFLLPY
jgi:hypothetical protein